MVNIINNMNINIIIIRVVYYSLIIIFVFDIKKLMAISTINNLFYFLLIVIKLENLIV
mgnify:CR=1 FL=1